VTSDRHALNKTRTEVMKL